MYKLWLLLLFNLNCLVKSYVNVAYNRPAWHRYPFFNGLWGAEHAVDGLYSNLSSIGGQCVISANYRSTAEWRVDLDLQNGYTCRFLGFSVYISNTTNKEDGKLCFKDTNYTRATIPNPTNITCITHGRYVIYHNNRIHPPYPAGYSRFAFNELCELEVYGCPTRGYFGEDCYQRCPQNCQEGHCHIVDGTCLGCVAGYTGPNCNEQCSSKTYGPECQQNCGSCKNREQCHHVHGRCPNGCDRGWHGAKCSYTCNNNTYGYRCSLKCGNCLYLYGEQCHHVTGHCPRGCDVGYQGDRCDQVTTDPVSNCQSSIPLYVCVSIIILFGLVIVFLVTRQLGISVCKPQKSQKIRIEKLDKRKKVPEYIEPSLVFVCDQENTTAHAYEELGEISPYYQNDKLP